jgi:hypothetical protein
MSLEELRAAMKALQMAADEIAKYKQETEEYLANEDEEELNDYQTGFYFGRRIAASQADWIVSNVMYKLTMQEAF